MDIALYTLSFICGAIVGVAILRILQIDAENKEFDRLNKSGKIYIEPLRQVEKRNRHADVEWQQQIIHGEGRN